jgi:hypothetical protein
VVHALADPIAPTFNLPVGVHDATTHVTHALSLVLLL